MPKPTPAPRRNLSSKRKGAPSSLSTADRYDIANAGPAVRDKAARLVGKAISIAPTRTLSSVLHAPDRPDIVSNVHPAVRLIGSEASISGITSAADQYNSYRFDELTATKTYKKMMTLHLKERMFKSLKFISNDSQLEFGRSPVSICGYVCTQMRVPDFQWGDYWELVRQTTKKMIEHQRTNATSAVKKGFRGKYN